MRTGHEIYTTKVKLMHTNCWGAQLGDPDWTGFLINGAIDCQSSLKRPYLWYFQPNMGDIINPVCNPQNNFYLRMLFQLYEKVRIASVAFEFRPTFTKEMIAINPESTNAGVFNFNGYDVSSRQLVYGFSPNRRRVPISGVNDTNLQTGWDNIMEHQTGIKKHSMNTPLRVYFKPTAESLVQGNLYNDDGNGVPVNTGGAGSNTTTLMASSSATSGKTCRSPWEYTAKGTANAGNTQTAAFVSPYSALHGMYLGFPAFEFNNFKWMFNVTYYVEFKDRRSSFGNHNFAEQ